VCAYMDAGMTSRPVDSRNSEQRNAFNGEPSLGSRAEKRKLSSIICLPRFRAAGEVSPMALQVNTSEGLNTLCTYL